MNLSKKFSASNSVYKNALKINPSKDMFSRLHIIQPEGDPGMKKSQTQQRLSAGRYLRNTHSSRKRKEQQESLRERIQSSKTIDVEGQEEREKLANQKFREYNNMTVEQLKVLREKRTLEHKSEQLLSYFDRAKSQ